MPESPSTYESDVISVAPLAGALGVEIRDLNVAHLTDLPSSLRAAFLERKVLPKSASVSALAGG